MLATAAGLVLGTVIATPQETADEIVARVQSSLGAPERLAAVANRVFEGSASFEGFGEPGTSREILETLGNARIKSSLPGFGDFEEGASHGVVWEIHPMAGSALIKTGVDAMTRLRYYAILQNRPWDELYWRAELLGSEKLGERDCYKLKMHPRAMALTEADGKARIEIGSRVEAADEELPAPDVWFVDAETFLPGRVDIQLKNPAGQRVEMKLALSEWKPVDGIQYPHRRRSSVQGFHWNVEIASIQHDVEIPAGTFELPPKVLDALNAPASADAEPEEGEIKIEEVKARHAAVIRLKCPKAEISSQLAIALPEVMIHLTSIGAKVTGAPFTRYFSFDEEEIDFEAGIPIAEPIVAKGRIRPVELMGGPCVSVWHVGPYEELDETHARISEWVAENEIVVKGPCLEIYWTDPGMEPDPAKWRTQILWPCEAPEPKKE